MLLNHKREKMLKWAPSAKCRTCQVIKILRLLRLNFKRVPMGSEKVKSYSFPAVSKIKCNDTTVETASEIKGKIKGTPWNSEFPTFISW